MQALYLFDIDGTLLRAGTEVHKASFTHAFQAVYGLPLSLEGIPAGGRTDTWLLAEPLRRAGLDDDRIWQKMPEAFAVMQAYTEEHLGDLRGCVLPGVVAVLERLLRRGHLLGLLTGNLSRIAWAKMRNAGLEGYFQVGGFGEESEVRAHLVPVALAAAVHLWGRPFPAEHAVLVGDTPLDVEAGKAHGLKTVGVATGSASQESLVEAGADVVMPSFEESEAALERLLELADGPS
jgi:phosphoglycolate phosphatase-like HAD superfamily hydrolase